MRRLTKSGGDREVRGGNGNRGSRDSVSRVEVPRPTDFPGDVRGACDRPIVSMSREILLKSGARESLHVVSQERIANREGESGSPSDRPVGGLDIHRVGTRWSARRGGA